MEFVSQQNTILFEFYTINYCARCCFFRLLTSHFRTAFPIHLVALSVGGNSMLRNAMMLCWYQTAFQLQMCLQMSLACNLMACGNVFLWQLHWTDEPSLSPMRINTIICVLRLALVIRTGGNYRMNLPNMYPFVCLFFILCLSTQKFHCSYVIAQNCPVLHSC